MMEILFRSRTERDEKSFRKDYEMIMEPLHSWIYKMKCHPQHFWPKLNTANVWFLYPGIICDKDYILDR